MAIRKVWASRVKNVTAEQFVGQKGTIFFNEPTGALRISDGVTPGGNPLTLVASDFQFQFGDFLATTETESPFGASLSSANEDQDINIVSNGTGAINVIGEFNVYKADGDVPGALAVDPVFSVDEQGDISASTLDITNTGDLGLAAPLNVSINAAGLTKTPTIVTGSVAQFTGRDNRSAILVIDNYGIDPSDNSTGGQVVFRTGRGTNASTTAVQNNDRLGLVTAAGWASNGYGGLGVGGLRILANENFTATARGSKLELFAIANGTLVPTTVATVDVANGITATKFTGPLTGTATTATNLAAASSILAGRLVINPTNIIKNTASIQTFTLSGLTTNHKILLQVGTSLTYGLTISAAWPSAANTLSIEFQNISNADIDLGNINIDYFAWV